MQQNVKAVINNQTSLSRSLCRVCTRTYSSLHNSLVRPEQGVGPPAVVRASLEQV